MEWSNDDLLKTHPGLITFNSVHNHSVMGSDILRHRRPAPEVVKKFTEMFSKPPYMSVTAAMDAHLSDLEVDSEFSLLTGTGDGADSPTMAWLYKLYNKIRSEICGAPYGEGMISALQKYIDQYNEECGEICVKMGSSPDGKHHYIVACTPLMKRVHTHLKSAGEIMFVDSSGSMDGNNSRIFMMMTCSVVGGLPLGFLLTFSEEEDVLTSALALWKTILPVQAFHGRGPEQGPKVIMTDDSKSERNGLTLTWPAAFLLLCIFHVLQAMWRYIWDSKHGVKAEHRSDIYFTFHNILYAQSPDEFNKLYDDALTNNGILSENTNSTVKKHIADLRARKDEWALCERQDILTRGNHTNNFNEAVMRILKDRILNRSKAYNAVELLPILLTRLDSYFKRKLAFVINNRAEGKPRTKYNINVAKLKPLVAEKISSSSQLYQVRNLKKNTTYVVDMDLEVCACPQGCCGAPCKHQFCVAQIFGVRSHQFLPYSDPTVRTELFYIMMGHTNVPPGWFHTLKGGEVQPVSLLYPQPSPELNEVPPASPADHDDVTNGVDQGCTTDAEERRSELANFTNDIMERITENSTLIEPLDKFLKSYWSIVHKNNYESTLASALSTFSKEVSAPQKHLRRGAILTQSTAVARRANGGGGRTAQKGGRPRTEKRPSEEHGYTLMSQGQKRQKQQQDNEDGASWAGPPKKKAKTPHSLMKCVEANVRLPK